MATDTETDIDEMLLVTPIDDVVILPPDRERRLVHRVLSLWRSLRPAVGFPSLDDLLVAGWSGLDHHMVVIELPTLGGDPTITHVGRAMAEHLGDLAGRPVRAVPRDTLAGEAIRHYRDVIGRRVPITVGGRFVDGQGRPNLFRSTLLPLSNDCRDLTTVACVANGRIVGPDRPAPA